jgi:predicted nucleic acid-binding protein
VIIVSDTSPLVGLAAIEQLQLLHKLYGRVVIPQAVYNEVVAGGDEPGAIEIQTVEWIEVRSVANRVAVTLLELELDLGESEAIALATELNADLLLLDERKGRAVAARLGLLFVGVLGVLVEAKQSGLIPALKPLLDDLVVNAGFRVRTNLYARVLREVGETP